MSVSRLVNSKIFVVIAAISCIITAFIGYDSAPNEAPEKEKCTLVRVVDGDTYIASLNGEEKRIRLIGVNTPESVAPADYAENTAEGEKVSDIIKEKKECHRKQNPNPIIWKESPRKYNPRILFFKDSYRICC